MDSSPKTETRISFFRSMRGELILLFLAIALIPLSIAGTIAFIQIERVQATVQEAIIAIDNTVTEVGHGSRLTGETARALQEILLVAEEAANHLQQKSEGLVGAMEAVSVVVEENNASAEEVNALAEEMSAQVEEMVSASQDLSSMAEQLRLAVAQLQIAEAPPIKREKQLLRTSSVYQRPQATPANSSRRSNGR